MSACRRQAHQVRVCLKVCCQTFEVASRSGCGVFLGKPINPEGRPRLIFCRSIRREKSGSSSAGLGVSWILAQGSHRLRRMLLRSNIYGRSKRVAFATRCANHFCAPSNMKRRKKIDPIVRLIEAMLDFALITGLLAAAVFLVSNTARLAF